MAASGNTKKSGNRRTGAKSPRKRTTAKPAASSKPVRREVGAVACLLLALFGFLGFIPVRAIFLDLYCGLLRGLFGYGYYVIPFALLVVSAILGFHRGRAVRLRVACALLTPVFLSAMLHLLFAKGAYRWSWGLFRALYQDGLSAASGGAAAGFLAFFFAAIFSKIGAGIIFFVGIALAVITVFQIAPVDILDYLRNRPKAEYEPEPEPDHDDEESAPPPPRTRRRQIDIPVDEPPSQLHPLPAPPPETPPLPPETPLPFSPPPETPLPVITREPAIRKTEKKDDAQVAQAAQEVAERIEKTMETTPTYRYPPLSLLDMGIDSVSADGTQELSANQRRLEDTIHSFGIEARVTSVVRGPSVTRYELELDRGVKLNKLTNLADDIALSLGVSAVRIAPIPDKISVVGIEVPNRAVSIVYSHDVIGSKAFTDHKSKVAFAIGRDIAGSDIVGDIAKLPHMLIAGTTGSGKSVCMNTIIVSLLYKATPEEVRLIMVDPKMIELGVYNGIPHLLIPVVTDPKKAAGALQWAVTEMMKRYRLFTEVGARDVASYNAAAAKDPDRARLSQIVIVIDELADLMLVAAKDVEESICRIAQMARAAGMHLIIATQRPSADVITGIMKANIPSRIAFAVASAMESRIILDTQGAEKLVGRGDMLYAPLGAGKPVRVQGCMITGEEVEAVVNFIKETGVADYSDEIIREIEQHAEQKEKGGTAPPPPEEQENDAGDELLPAAVEVLLETGQASVSMLQRRLKLGYSRAARLVDQMEERGIVGPFEGSKPRQLLITKEQWQQMRMRSEQMEPPPPAGDDGGPEQPEDP